MRPFEPGQPVVASDGTGYITAKDGSLRRVTAFELPNGAFEIVRPPKLSKAERKRAKKERHVRRNHDNARNGGNAPAVAVSVEGTAVRDIVDGLAMPALLSVPLRGGTVPETNDGTMSSDKKLDRS